MILQFLHHISHDSTNIIYVNLIIYDRYSHIHWCWKLISKSICIRAKKEVTDGKNRIIWLGCQELIPSWSLAFVYQVMVTLYISQCPCLFKLDRYFNDLFPFTIEYLQQLFITLHTKVPPPIGWHLRYLPRTYTMHAKLIMKYNLIFSVMVVIFFKRYPLS